MARVLGVSEAGYHAWRQREPSAHAQADAALLKRIRTIHAGSGEAYGAPRVHAELAAEGSRHGRKRIARLMRAGGLVGASRRRRDVITTRRDKKARPAPDLVERYFRAEGPNQLWVGDITYVRPPLASSTSPWSSMPGAGGSWGGRWRTICEPSSCSTPWRWRSASVNRAPSFTIPTREVSTPLSPSATAAGKPVFSLDGLGRRCLRQRHGRKLLRDPRMRTARPAGASLHKLRPEWPSSPSSRASTIQFDATPPSATARRSATRRRC